MTKIKYLCRNCGSANINKYHNGAIVFQFFAARVWGVSSVQLNKESRKVRLLNFLTFGLSNYVARMSRIHMDSYLCDTCSFYSTWNEIPECSLSALYKDYRSDSYNNEREKYEPGYTKNIAQFIGGLEESESRNYALNEYLSKIGMHTSFKVKEIRKALDWGGADGRFLPDFSSNCDRNVFEISSISPIKGVARIAKLNEDMRFDYIQLAHVLEHMSNPLRFMNEVVKHLSDDGYLYLEVPLEVNQNTFQKDIKARKILLYVHEHINKYTEKSLAGLAKSINLEVIDVCIAIVDLKWAKIKIIRLLAKKPLTESS
jgi:hypothetical protein